MSSESTKPRLVGINHLALEVDDVTQAVLFWRQLFDIQLQEEEPGAAFIDLGDQFIALMDPSGPTDDLERHFGLVVDDKEAARRVLEAAGVEILPGHRLDFRDPFGNRIQVVQYDQIQFAKSDRILRGMGLKLGKSESARAELNSKGLA
ncbi:MAG TPA: VOC family protein [Gaiellaceae bacterium]|nr:VOC family protein [Gaiellaceae bacterium]